MTITFTNSELTPSNAIDVLDNLVPQMFTLFKSIGHPIEVRVSNLAPEFRANNDNIILELYIEHDNETGNYCPGWWVNKRFMDHLEYSIIKTIEDL